MSYTAIGSGSITLNAMSAEEQKNLQEALMNRYDRLRTADLAQCGDDMAYQIEREYQELTQAMLKYNDPFWWLTVVFKEAGFTEVERNPNDVALSIELSYYNNYYEDMILELLNTLVPFTAEGFISYRGEEGDLWCHVFAGGEWTERSGRICYDEPRPQFEESKQNLERLIEEIRRQVIYDDRPYRINLRRFIDYILFDLYAQGYASVTKSFFVEYLDYLEMQQKSYGKVKEKYPTHFKTEHDIMALKVNQARLLAKCEDFEQQNESIKDLAYSGSGYCIVVPTKPEELAEEGINLSHCVGQYIDRVAGGDCHILFLRRRGAPDRSLVTLQLSGKQICQAQGFNRRPITDQERRFLVQWGREKDIQIAV